MNALRKEPCNSDIPASCMACDARQGGVCGAMTPAQLTELSRYTVRKKVRHGAELHGQGEKLVSYANILKGVVKLTKVMQDGRQQIVGLQFAPDFLGRPCRLVRFDPEHRRLSSMEWTGGIEAPNQFADGFPVLVVGEGSMAELNARLAAAGHAPVGVERFRPNVVLAGWDAHDEDRVDKVQVDAGDGGEILLQPVKPCARCPIPDIDPATAESTPVVGDALRTYRQDARLAGAITFGMNAIVRKGAGRLLRTGQRVAADLRFDD